MAAAPPPAKLGAQAPDLHLTGVDGKRHSLASARGPNGLASCSSAATAPA